MTMWQNWGYERKISYNYIPSTMLELSWLCLLGGTCYVFQSLGGQEKCFVVCQGGGVSTQADVYFDNQWSLKTVIPASYYGALII